MTAREYLGQYEEATRRAKRLREEYENEIALIDAVRSLSDNDGMPHGSGIRKPTEDKAVRLIEKAARWKEAEIEAIQIRMAVFEMVESIPGLEGDVLFHRFVNLEKWELVCHNVGYTWPSVREAWHRGEDMVQAKLDKI